MAKAVNDRITLPSPGNWVASIKGGTAGLEFLYREEVIPVRKGGEYCRLFASLDF